MSKKAITGKKVEKCKGFKSESTVNTKVKDSTEIDDLFSVLSASKKPAEVPLFDLEDLDDSHEEEAEEDVNENSEEVIKGIAYDPKKDDAFPVSNSNVTQSSAAAIHKDSDFFDSRGLKRKARPLTEDGLPIFSPNELKIGLGGGTDLCPFDCNCCY